MPKKQEWPSTCWQANKLFIGQNKITNEKLIFLFGYMNNLFCS
jgi:hypothetical protein